MKLVVVADFHLHPYRLCSRDGGHDRLLDGLSVLRQSLELAKRLDATWIMAGDFKMPKTFWPQEALTGAHEILREFTSDDQHSVCKVMLSGNHDAQGLGGSGLAPFEDCAAVIDEPLRVCAGDGKTSLVCAPWDADLAQVRELLAAREHSTLVAHGFLQGCMLGPEDVRIAKGTSITEYGDFAVAFFGDVHKGQWRRLGGKSRGPEWAAYPSPVQAPPPWIEYDPILVRKRGPWAGEVFYAGSPFQQNWGEREDPPKGALVADTETGEVWLHPLRSPRYRHFEVGEDGLAAFLARRSAYAGDFVRVVYAGKPCVALDQAREVGEEFRSYQLVIRQPERQERRADVHAGMPMRDLLERYVDARPPSDGVNRSKVFLAGQRLASAEVG